MTNEHIASLAKELGLDVEEVLEPFEVLHSWNVPNLDEFNQLSRIEKDYAIYLIKDEQRMLQEIRAQDQARKKEKRGFLARLVFGQSTSSYQQPSLEEQQAAHDERKHSEEERFGEIPAHRRASIRFLVQRFTMYVEQMHTHHVFNLKTPDHSPNYIENVQNLMCLWLEASES